MGGNTGQHYGHGGHGGYGRHHLTSYITPVLSLWETDFLIFFALKISFFLCWPSKVCFLLSFFRALTFIENCPADLISEMHC